MWIHYIVNVGTGEATNDIHVDDNATEAEIAEAILDDLYDVRYIKIPDEQY